MLTFRLILQTVIIAEMLSVDEAGTQWMVTHLSLMHVPVVVLLMMSSVCVCRFLEVDGDCVTHLTDCQLYKLLNGKPSGVVKVVVLRAPVDELDDDDVESLRNDLSLVLMEVDSLQSENRQLTAQLERSVHILRHTVHSLATGDTHTPNTLCFFRST